MHAVLLLRRGLPGNHLLGRSLQQRVEFFETRVHITRLFPRFIRVNHQSLTPVRGVTRSPQLGVQQMRNQGEQRSQGNFEGRFGIYSVSTGLALRTLTGKGKARKGKEVRMSTDLFTFCPPGPLERLKEIWPIWRGIEWIVRDRSHRLASSWSEVSADLEEFEADLRETASTAREGWINHDRKVILTTSCSMVVGYTVHCTHSTVLDRQYTTKLGKAAEKKAAWWGQR